ncbi:unnamed protein product [Brassica rapa]|uniref:Uncharacterized protein n=2 Tax=Brassica TaxID=3705 RepID=A0A8D9HES7_BRACM|nr:unnamed protein product [Brassica napus]CAG7897084.1 unnamed protein product [Brassica rapa]CDY66382.1 BnaA08g29840D [Brassica napus]
MRIGQALTDANTENEASAPCTTKRKPGRPPGSSKAPGKQTMPASPAPKKRRVSQPKPSPARRKSNAAKTTKKSDARGGTSRAVAQQDSSTASENVLLANFIPKPTRRRMDFRIPSHPLLSDS